MFWKLGGQRFEPATAVALPQKLRYTECLLRH